MPPWTDSPGTLLSVTRTPDEVSIVCDATLPPAEARAERGWSCLRVLGPLDFALVGILASITSALASAGISLFALSTYDTDYVLVRTSSIEDAIVALTAAGHSVRR